MLPGGTLELLEIVLLLLRQIDRRMNMYAGAGCTEAWIPNPVMMPVQGAVFALTARGTSFD